MIELEVSCHKVVTAGIALDGVYLRPFDNPNPIDPFAYIGNPGAVVTEVSGGGASAGFSGGTYPWLNDPGSSSLTGQP